MTIPGKRPLAQNLVFQAAFTTCLAIGAWCLVYAQHRPDANVATGDIWSIFWLVATLLLTASAILEIRRAMKRSGEDAGSK